MFLLNVVFAWVMTATAAPLAEGKRTMCAKDYEPERADGRTSRTMTWAMLKLRQANPPRENPVLADSETFLAWRKDDLAGRTKALAGVSADPDFKLLKEERRTGYALRTYEFYPEDGLAVRTLVLVPDSARPGKTPMVVCLPGTAGSLESLAGEPDPYLGEWPVFPLRNRQAWWYCQCGMIGVALENAANANNAAPDLRYWKSQLRCRELFREIGVSEATLSVRTIATCVNFLKKDPLVDRTRIAVSGMSLGAMVLYSALANPNVAACVYNDFRCSGLQRRMATTNLPSGTTHGGSGMGEDILALAPKPLLLNEGGAWMGVIRDIVRAYELSGHPENLSVHYYDKYADPKDRLHEDVDLRAVTGLDGLGYFEYNNCDHTEHSFHAESALPWLSKLFFGRWEPSAELQAEIDRAHAQKSMSLDEYYQVYKNPEGAKRWPKCAPLRESFEPHDYEPERADGRTERTMVWAAMRLRRQLKSKSDAVADKFKLLETRTREGYTVEVYEFYPDEQLVVKTMVLVPDGVPRWMTSVEVIFGKNGASVEHLAGEPDPYRAPDGDHLAQVAAKAGKIAIALALPGEANGAPDDVNSADSRKKYLALLPDSGWTDERLKDLERTMCVDYVRGCGIEMTAKRALR